MSDEILNTGLELGKPYLGSPAVVASIIKEALMEFLDLAMSKPDDAEFRSSFEDICDRYQSIFYGEDDRYLSFGWNSPSQLGKCLVFSSGIGGDTDDAPKRIFGEIGRRLIAGLSKSSSGDLDDKGLQEEITSIIGLFQRVLLGIPE